MFLVSIFSNAFYVYALVRRSIFLDHSNEKKKKKKKNQTDERE